MININDLIEIGSLVTYTKPGNNYSNMKFTVKSINKDNCEIYNDGVNGFKCKLNDLRPLLTIESVTNTLNKLQNLIDESNKKIEEMDKMGLDSIGRHTLMSAKLIDIIDGELDYKKKIDKIVDIIIDMKQFDIDDIVTIKDLSKSLIREKKLLEKGLSSENKKRKDKDGYLGSIKVGDKLKIVQNSNPLVLTDGKLLYRVYKSEVELVKEDRKGIEGLRNKLNSRIKVFEDIYHYMKDENVSLFDDSHYISYTIVKMMNDDKIKDSLKMREISKLLNTSLNKNVDYERLNHHI
ncbi:MAG: hypothetical protein KDH96_10190 [Candidatus Riesia sp.]|nr:hypothetical protein [Candidatus Riesia sp.]